MRICLEQFKCLGVLATCVRVVAKEPCGAPIVLLSENELPRHLNSQFGEALYVLINRLLDEATRVQIRL